MTAGAPGDPPAGGWADGVRLAVTTFTVAPLRGPARIDPRTAGRAMCLAPPVGLTVGILTAAAVLATRFAVGGSALLPAAVGVAVPAAVSRGLHLDGLADLADGLGASRRADRSLAVMAEPAVGAFGTITVALTLLIQFAALATAVAHHHGTVAVLVSATTGRLAVTVTCGSGAAPARPYGLGATVAGTVGRRAAAGAVVGVCALAGAIGWLDHDGGSPLGGVRAAAAVLVGLGAAAVLLRLAVRRLGGITGDVLGALVEVAATAVLVVMAFDPR